MGDRNSFQCSSCGAQLTEGVKRGKVVCPYCGTVNIFSQQTKTDGMLICPNCGAANHTQAEYCEECGQGLYIVCPKCGTRNKSDAAHCTKCGTRLDEEIKLRQQYFDYLAEARRIKKKFSWKIWPWYLSLIPTLFAVFMNISQPFYNAGLTIFSIFVFSIPALILIPVGNSINKKKNRAAANEVEKIGSKRKGFAEFYELYAYKYYWTVVMVEGEKRVRFMKIIGMK